tara:strand:+ start:605 stop:793 length:189 start_codon:yes stop_codon:yes gene_type:complete
MKRKAILVGSKDRAKVKKRRRRIGQASPEVMQYLAQQTVETATQRAARRIANDFKKLNLGII